MKNVFQIILVLSLLTGLVGCGTSPENLQVSKIIGAEGGTLTSADGAITLNISAGTFASPTTVSVEPTTSSDAPWGEANGWRLNGLGIQMKAVDIKFKYSDELPIEWSSVAMQDESKAWFGFTSTVVNKSEKTVSITLPAQTRPGSVAELNSRVQVRDTPEKRIYIYNDFIFKPLAATIKVKAALKMTLEICRPKYSTNGTKLVSMSSIEKECISTLSSVFPTRQYVNGVEHGDSTFGAVITVISLDDNTESYEYIAPPKVPSPNPVTINTNVTISKNISKSFNTYVTIEPECFPSGNLIQSTVSKTTSISSRQTQNCNSSYTGTTSTVIGGLYELTTQVTWILDLELSSDKELVYHPKGKATAKVLPSGNCTTTITPNSHLMSEKSEGDLKVDLTTNPPTYTGTGATLWATTYTQVCPDSTGSFPSGIGGAWFSGTGTTSTNGSEITGSFTGAGQTWNYNFKRD